MLTISGGYKKLLGRQKPIMYKGRKNPKIKTNQKVNILFARGCQNFLPVCQMVNVTPLRGQGAFIKIFSKSTFQLILIEGVIAIENFVCKIPLLA